MKDAAYSLFVVIFFVATLILLSHHGNKSRTLSPNVVTVGEGIPEIVVVDEQREVYNLWKKRGLHGRVVLHFDNNMDIKPPRGVNLDIILGKFPGLLSSLAKDELDNENFMLFAIGDDVIRKLIGVTSEGIFNSSDKAIKGSEYFKYEGFYRGTVQGVPKVVTITGNLSPFKEPVLLDFDAAFFSNPDVGPEELFKRLKGLGIKTDLITCSLSIGEKGVTSYGIEKMKKFIELFKGI